MGIAATDLVGSADMLELDVLPEPGHDRLVLAHDAGDFRKAQTLIGLDEALVRLAASPFSDLGLNVDLKQPGHEQQVVESLRKHDLVSRTLVSSMYRRSLATLQRIEPGLRIGWSVPRASRDYTRSALLYGPVLMALALLRRVLPNATGRMIRHGRCDAIMAYRPLATAALARAVRDAGGELYVWPVDDMASVRRLGELGVTGVIVDDPTVLVQAAREASLSSRPPGPQPATKQVAAE